MAELQPNEYVGCRYIVKYKSGKGKAGGQVYGVEDSRDPDGPRKVIKYPARREEYEALQRLYKTPEPPLGLSRFFDCGQHREGKFIAMEHLGRPLLEVLRSLRISADARWGCLRILGRMVLRRLEVIHRAGIVHCDVQPGNLLLERTGTHHAGLRFRPFLIDFGCAQCLPWDKPLRPDFGTVDFNSIHSAQGGSRGPCDDVESLGWVLVHGLFGELPWFEVTKKAKWTGGKLEESQRWTVCGKVADAKTALLEQGAEAFDCGWSYLECMPDDLRSFIRNVYERSFQGGQLPDYRALDVILGGRGAEPATAELEDQEEYTRHQRRCEAAMLYADNLRR